MWKMTEPSYVVINKANSHLVFLKFFDQIHTAGKLRTNSGNVHDDSVKKKKQTTHVIHVSLGLTIF